jgi:hypothetical protein
MSDWPFGELDPSANKTIPLQTYNLLCYPKESLPCEAAEIMLKASSEERGTVAGLAALSQDLKDAAYDGTSIPTICLVT